MADDGEGNKENGIKRLQFRMPEKRQVVAKIPKVHDLVSGTHIIRPSDTVVAKIGSATLVVGVDIETHDWEGKAREMCNGRFGFFHIFHPDNLKQRIVQIGWAIGEAAKGAPLSDQAELLIQPAGFNISPKATHKHGISNDRANSEGLPLRVALGRFMDALCLVDSLGGRLVVHHLEFDAGIIDNELENAGLHHLRPRWCEIARKGFCTMDPDVGAWVQACRGRDVQRGEDGRQALSLAKAVNLLVPKDEATQHLLQNAHTAGADAQLHRLVYIALLSLLQESGA